MGITYNGTKIKKAVFNGAPLKQIMLNDVKLLSSEPFNEALALVGYGDFDTLNDVLANSAVCTAIANNIEAYSIMKNNYSTEMTNAIDTLFNVGLNLLNYKCTLKCYVFKSGYDCTGVSGGWVKSTSGGNYYYTNGNANMSTDGGNSYVSCCTVNAIPFTSTGYKKAVGVIESGNWGDPINGHPAFRAVKSKSSPGSYNSEPYVKVNNGSGTYTLNLSSYLGDRYMWMYCPSTSSVTLKSLYITP